MKMILDIKVEKIKVLQAMQCKKESELFSYYEEIFDKIFSEVEELIKPVCYYSLEDENTLSFPSLKSAEKIIYSIVSLGPKINSRIEELFACEEYLEAMMLNTIGDIALFNASNDASEFMKGSLVKNDLSLSVKYSPGSHEIPNEFQGDILQILNEDIEDNISITSGSMLYPEKSLSFIHGIGNYDKSSYKGHDCSRCNLESCLYNNDVCGGHN